MVVLAAAGDFKTFGATHLWAVAVSAAVAAGLIVLCRRSPSDRAQRWVRWALATLLVGNECSYYVYKLATADPWMLLREGLPLHICAAGLYLMAWVLVRPNQLVYETAYFWGLAGTFQALITPSLQYDFPHVRFFQYFITHSGIVTAVLVATFVMKMRPRKGSVFRVFLLTNAMLAVVGVVNWLLGANYMFLCGPPKGESFWFFLPWPWYILFLEPVALGLFALVYSPVWLASRRERL